jgi:hypothetical protein
MTKREYKTSKNKKTPVVVFPAKADTRRTRLMERSGINPGKRDVHDDSSIVGLFLV